MTKSTVPSCGLRSQRGRVQQYMGRSRQAGMLGNCQVHAHKRPGLSCWPPSQPGRAHSTATPVEEEASKRSPCFALLAGGRTR